MDCLKCLNQVVKEDIIKCTEPKHYFCNGKMSKEVIQTWKCFSCKDANRGNNSGNKTQEEHAFPTVEINKLLTQQLTALNKDLSGKIGKLQNTIDCVSVQFDEFKEDIQNLKETNAQLLNGNHHLKEELEQVKERNENLESYTKRDNHGNPTHKSRKPHRIFVKLNDPQKPSPIVVRFVRRTMRDHWMNTYHRMTRQDKTGPGLDLKKINVHLPSGRFKLTDQLTQHKIQRLVQLENYDYSVIIGDTNID
ncbi:hypothetical protein FQR65_LT02653 [Abscondita terminalis]|nr:hypothetical protein FQR65_LT02653 [Abscondita terminalis]